MNENTQQLIAQLRSIVGDVGQGVLRDRKVLADIAVHDAATFTVLAEAAQVALDDEAQSREAAKAEA